MQAIVSIEIKEIKHIKTIDRGDFIQLVLNELKSIDPPDKHKRLLRIADRTKCILRLDSMMQHKHHCSGIHYLALSGKYSIV